MRKAITIMIVLALGVSLWADNAQTKPVKGARVSSDRFPLHTSTNDNDRTESYTLVMVDAYGDGWNGGAAVDVLVNGTVVLDDATVPTGYEGATENFDVEVGDAVTTVWTAGTWDSECAYAIYNPAGVLVAQAGTAVHPELEVAFTVSPTHIGVWFSEYAEGSSNNKYLEIYNGTDADVDLTGLAFPNVSNEPTVPGEHEYWNEFPAGATVAPGDVYVIAHGSADAAILAEADHTFTYLSNGDDGFCVVLGAEGNFSILDCIGDWNGDPGDGWDVAGVSDATKDHTLQRKTDVIWGNSGDWVGSAGTTADNSEWIVLENEDWTGLGSHGSSCNLTHDLTVNMVDSYGDGWNGNVLTVGDATFTIESGSEGTGSLCLDDGTFAVTCDGGSYQTEVSWSIVDAAGTVLLEGGAPYDGVLQLGDATEVMGCTDPAAINYDPNATFNDGSCYYQGDSCSIALDFVTAGGTLDGVTPVTGALEASASKWYTFTLDQAWENLSVSLIGSEFDTKLDLHTDCATMIATNDDFGGLQSQIDLVDAAAGTYVARVYGYGTSFGNYTLTVNAYQNPTNPTGLSALGGLERVYLSWDPVAPAGTAASVATGFDGSVEELIEWNYDNKKNPTNEITGYRAPTREMLMETISNDGQTRDTEVIVTLYDAFGDGHYGGDCDGCAYIVDSEGTVLETLEGGWTGTEAAFGPFTLADGAYSVEWDQTASWLSEQTMEVTAASDGTVLGSGAAPSACFALGDGYACGFPDLTVDALTYDSWTGRATVTVSNIGGADAGYFYTMAFIQEPDTTNTYPPGYFQYAWEGVGLAAGATADFYLDTYLTLPGFVGGYDGETYTLYAMADGYGNYVFEESEGNNVASISVVNTSPLANSSWNVYRDGTNIQNVTAPGWEPGLPILYTDEPLTADVQYCYTITQVDGTTESGASDESCATPSAPPDVPEPTDLAGSSSGFDVTLTWTAPEPMTGTGLFLGTPSSTRQGGEDIENATVITELEQLTGTTAGYLDDYDEVCPYVGGGATDVVYSFTPATDVAVNMTTCYSSFDTKLYVYENAAGTLATTVTGDPACSDDSYPPGVDDCTTWTSYIEGVWMAAGNTYYLVVDGYGASAGDYVVDMGVYNPLAGYTIWSLDAAGAASAVGQAGPTATEWNTVLFAAEPTDLDLAITAVYNIPGIFDPVFSDVVGPVTVTVQIEDSPNNLVAEDSGDDVHLMWDPPIDASSMELAYDDGVVANAYYYGGAVAVRFRVNGTYAVNGIANTVWTGGWPDAFLGETPYTLSVLAVDAATDMPGDTLFSEEVLVDADPTSETYGWAMTSALADAPVTITGDVFIMYSDFGYDFDAGGPGADMDMMGCDAVVDFPGNRYEYIGAPGAGEWAMSANTVTFGGCGDWILHLFADFTAGGNASFGQNGTWIDQSGSPSLADLPLEYAMMEAASTKENPVQLMNPPVSDPVWAHEAVDRDMLNYNIYRDGEVVGEQAPGVHDYVDGGLDWGTYTYYVTALYDAHESIATNSVEVTLSNVAPDAVMLISPGDDLEISVNEGNMSEEVAFIWTAANDADNDLVEYFLGAFAELSEGDTSWAVMPDNPMDNAGFEETTLQDNGWQYLPDGWEGYPNQNSQTVAFTGDDVWGSEFEAFEDSASVKLWGLYEGENTENNIFQTWYDGEVAPGTQFHISAAVMSHSSDWIGQGGNTFVLFAKYFTADWGWLGMNTSEVFSGADSADVWYWLGAECTVPEGASTVQVGAMLVQPTADDHGAVFMDEFEMHVPMTTTGIFVSNEELAWEAIENGITNLTWTWDVWSHDGFEFVPSSSGPRDIHVDVSELLGIDGSSLPREFALHNNYPNPFNPVTNIVYDIPEVTDVTLEIYNVMGQRVRTLAQGSHEAGRYQIVWNATNDLGQALSSGMYIYRIQAGDFVSVKKLVLMK